MQGSSSFEIVRSIFARSTRRSSGGTVRSASSSTSRRGATYSRQGAFLLTTSWVDIGEVVLDHRRTHRGERGVAIDPAIQLGFFGHAKQEYPEELEIENRCEIYRPNNTKCNDFLPA